MQLYDKRERHTITEAQVADVYNFGDGITLTLDTGYLVILNKTDIKLIREATNESQEHTD